MAKKKRSVAEDLIVGGVGLSVGSTIVGTLPASAAQAGVQAGLGTAGSFFPVMGTIGGAGMAMKQLKKLKKK